MPKSTRIALALILVLAAALRFGLSDLAQKPVEWIDAAAYHQIALNLVNGHGYSTNLEAPFAPTRVRTPTYPVFIAAIYAVFGPHHAVVLHVQRLLGVGVVLLAFMIGKRLWTDREALIAALIAATYPALVYYDQLLLRESLTVFLVVLIIFLAIKRDAISLPRIFVLGVVFAAASMCRPETLLLVFPIGYWLFKPLRTLKHRWRQMAIYALPLLLVWIPWTARNYIYFGSPSPITAGLGTTLWFGSRWAAIGGDNHTDEARKELRSEVKHLLKQAGTEKGIEQNFLNLVVQDFAQRPFWLFHMVGSKMVLFWQDANGVKKTLPRIHPWLPILLNTYYYGLLLLALWGVGTHRRHPQVRLLFGFVITYMMIYALLHVRNRYRVPVLPIVFTLSAGGFWALWDAIKMRVSPEKAAADQPDISPSHPKENPREHVIL